MGLWVWFGHHWRFVYVDRRNDHELTGRATGIKALAPDLARLPIVFNLKGFSLQEGLRAGLSTAVIVAASEWLDWPGLIEAALAALFTCLCDAGGPIRRRVPALLTFAVLGALVIGGGGLVRSLGFAVALPFAVIGLFCFAYVRVCGQSAQQVGALLCVTLVLSLDRALPDLKTAATLGGMFLAGGLWATLLTMVLWPVYPFGPARAAVGKVFGTLGLLIHDLEVMLASHVHDDTAWDSHARLHRRAARDAIEAARVTVLEAIRARGPASHRAAQSLIRLETADQLFGVLIALSDFLEDATEAERDPALMVLRLLQPLLGQLGHSIAHDSHATNEQTVAAIAEISAIAAGVAEGAPLRLLVASIVERLQILHTLAVPGNFVPGASMEGHASTWWQRVRVPLLANLNWESLAFRHALRAAVTAAPAIAFTLIWFTPYDHWLTITIVATMQPYFGNTFTRALERVGGTLLGGILATVIGLFVTTPLGIAVSMFPLAVLALAIRSVSFGLFMAAMTPMIVLLVELGQADTSEWVIAGARAGLTLAGGVIAIGGCWFLWPSWEPQRLEVELRNAVTAHRRYAEALLSLFLQEADREQVDAARRAAGLATNNVEASVSRALLEPGTAAHEKLEPAMVIDAALRRFAGRLSAMQLDPNLGLALPPAFWRDWRSWIGEAMQAIAAGTGTIPARPQLGAGPQAEALGRIARQVELMAGTLRRTNA